MIPEERGSPIVSNAAIWSVPGRPTRIVVDLDAITGNVRYFTGLVSPETDVMAVVKADGYGHGAAIVAREAVAAGATNLAVATVDEGVSLRRFGVTAPILVLGPIDVTEISVAIEADLALTVADPTFVDVIARVARTAARTGPVSIHAKVDTGMRRFGAAPADAVRLCAAVSGNAELRLDGLYTHFADADGGDDRFTIEQANRFETCECEVRAAGIDPGVVHFSNSAAALRWRRFDRGIVRIGIALYGLAPSPAFEMPAELRPALSLWSRISRVARVEPGETVSYGRTYAAQESEMIGLIPIGYADGYRRELSNRGIMAAEGVNLTVRGRVCMDQTVVGLPRGSAPERGTRVEVISADRRSVSSIAAIARMAGTIDYEVATGLSRRIPRLYVKGGRVVAVQDLHAVRLLDAPD